jgi:hypothetical protein
MDLRKLISFVSLVVALPTIVAAVACGVGAAPASTTSSTSAPSQSLDDLMRRTGPAEIVYRLSSGDPSQEVGIVVWRATGPLRRWDTLKHPSVSPVHGSFEVFTQGRSSGKSFSCDWTAAPDDTREVGVQCDAESGNAGTVAEITLEGGYAITDPAVRRIDDRTILGNRVPCYKGASIEAICIDEGGRMLYFEMAFPTGGKEILEATSVADTIETFGWPGDSSLGTPSPNWRTMAASTIDLPSQFQLSP